MFSNVFLLSSVIFINHLYLPRLKFLGY